MTHPFFTIGHSTHPLSEFVGLLKGSEIGTLVDVRSIPRSRTNPQFNRDTLPDTLALEHIGYVHLAELGGRRGRRKDDTPSPNAYWRHPAFRNYADYAMGDAFRDGFAQLLALGHRHRCVIMCSEAVWWRCHRRIITDYLLLRGETVLHIMDSHHTTAATMTPGAQPQPDGTLIYPAQTEP
ncbi:MULTISPECIES: DUF488 family protein [Paraburkholderia]|uniref:DNA repair protein n=1 Tax=Paraburkholderia nemoris TaxID=2793076 RepID=A0ABM8T1Q1_9BURK|nr:MULTISPECIES: DUF488 domain-containing protein [Paraburkholderia]MBK5151843.1 DUF488 domain-containing protein [Burkholderia sp. R-69608]MBK5183217.1 DUF488 domain-containing protein [Burkholderia sp. R-69749]MBK3743972.1 DUF488 domain-containing protein [Paraburkholderia aspalathi]MBK3815897.1 DUF488 domain-containing protein [Paraburkholderia aspalathi]CAE6826702.1 hypothetical protein R69619_06374 [Paraburkholderia nemoris]